MIRGAWRNRDIRKHPAIAPSPLWRAIQVLFAVVLLLGVAIVAAIVYLDHRAALREAQQAHTDAQFQQDHAELDRDHSALCSLFIALPPQLKGAALPDSIKGQIEAAAKAAGCKPPNVPDGQRSASANRSAPQAPDGFTSTPPNASESTTNLGLGHQPVSSSPTPGAGVTAAPPTPGHTSRPAPTVTRPTTEPAAPQPQPSTSSGLCLLGLIGDCG